MYSVLILHILFAIWIYGNSNVFPQVFFYDIIKKRKILKSLELNFLKQYQNYFNDFFNDINGQTDYFEVFKDRMLKSQCFILFLLLIFLLFYLLVRLYFFLFLIK